MNIVEREWREFSNIAKPANFPARDLFVIKCFYVRGFTECSRAFELMVKNKWPYNELIHQLITWFDELVEIIQDSNSNDSVNVESLQTSLTPLEGLFKRLTEEMTCDESTIFELKRALITGFQHCICHIGNDGLEDIPIEKTINNLLIDSETLMNLLMEKQAKGEFILDDATNSKIH